MTVSSQTNQQTFNGNGVTVVWDIPFRFFDNSDILAYVIDPVTSVTTPLVLGTDYTLTGAGLPEQFGTAPGKITTTIPVAIGKDLFVQRILAIEQLTDIINQGQFFPETHEDVFDRLTMLIQQNDATLRGAIRVAVGDPEPARLPAASTRANMLMGFNSAGDPIPVIATSGSATDLALDLANSANPSKGAGMIGYTAPDGHPSSTVFARLSYLDGVSPPVTNADANVRSSVNSYRDASALSGGTPGFVNAGIWHKTRTGPTETAFEWGIVSVVDNYSAVSENVGVYGQTNKHAQGGSWGGVWEVCDFNDRLSAVGDGLTWGGEIDVWTDFDDPIGVRQGLSIVVGSKVNVRDGLIPGQQAVASIGLNVTSYGGNSNYAIWKTGINVDKVSGSAIKLTGGATRGLQFSSGTYAVGIDISGAAMSGPAIRLAQEQSIAFDATDSHLILWHNTGNLQYKSFGTVLLDVSDTGNLNITGGYRIGGTQVVTSRRPGWVAMTGNLNRNTVYATSTITLVQLAERVKALQDDLTTHGLLGA